MQMPLAIWLLKGTQSIEAFDSMACAARTAHAGHVEHDFLPIGEAIDRCHMYLTEQEAALDSDNFRIVLASHCRQLKLKIEMCTDDVDAETCKTHVESIRTGPWTGVQTQVLCVAIDCWFRSVQAKAVQLCDRKPQVCCNPELFFSDVMWQRVHDNTKQRPDRIKAASDILISMDLTHPCPQTKQRVIAMLVFGRSVDSAVRHQRQTGTGRAG